MGWACGTWGERRGAYRFWVGIPEGKRPLGRPRRRWVDNIKIDVKEIGLQDVDQIDLAQDRDNLYNLVYTVMNLFGSTQFRVYLDQFRKYQLLKSTEVSYGVILRFPSTMMASL